MSFDSILGPSNNDPTPKAVEAKQPPARPMTPPPSKPVAESKPSVSEKVAKPEIGPIHSLVNGDTKPVPQMDPVPYQRNDVPPPPPRTKATEEELEKVTKALNAIDETRFSDVEDEGFARYKQAYQARGKKRAADVVESEVQKRKVSSPSTAILFFLSSVLNLANAA
jgi:hypothetical protein